MDQNLGQWNAKWIGYAAHPSEDLGVFAFRRTFSLSSAPPEYWVKVSADNRYKLYVNGQFVTFGPQRGDEKHWFYETLDLAQYLTSGENTILALVWNFGRWAPMAQHTVRTGFVLDGPEISTPTDWQVTRLDGWGFDMMHSGVGEFYIDIGPGEVIDTTKVPSPLQAEDDNSGEVVPRSHQDEGQRGGFIPPYLSSSQPPPYFPPEIILNKWDPLPWRTPHVISNAEERGTLSGGTPWMLIARSIPLMRYDLREISPTIRSENLDSKIQNPKSGIDLLPGQPLILDYGELLCAYPRVGARTLNRAQTAVVKITYAEAPWVVGKNEKGNRDDLKGKEIRGYQDRFLFDDGGGVAEPLWWRTYRYIQIETDIPIHIYSFDAIETGYPLQEESSFSAEDPWVEKIWQVSVRTAERCAGETYFDCPYYEQLQYVGDTRIQALIGYYLGRDRALTRNAVETLGWSIMENGLTQSRYPSRQPQVIPPFSLWWVMMLYDQMLYDRVENEPLEIQPYQYAERVLDGFRGLAPETGEFWPFEDWIPGWRWGVPPDPMRRSIQNGLASLATAAKDHLSTGGLDVSSWLPNLLNHELNGQDAETQIDWIDNLRAEEGFAEERKQPGATLEQLTEHYEAVWRQLYFMVGETPPPWPTEALKVAKAPECTYYFQYYKHLAMQPDDYMALLKPWKEMIENGLTTFAETPEPTRSDCHAWSAHPILGFFQLVAGVTSIAPGWKKARIAPKPGSLKRFDAQIAHPDGLLRVLFEGEKLKVETPVEVDLHWQGKKQTLIPGTYQIG